MTSHQLPNGIDVSSFTDASDWPVIAFGLRQRRVVLGAEGDPTRPILVLHSNGHMVTVNSAALALVGYDRGSNVEGIGKFPDGGASGEVRGMAAMQPLLRRLGVDFRTLSRAETSLVPFAQACNRCGVTTATDLINELTVEEVTRMRAVIERAEFPIRLYSALSAHTAPPEEIVALALKLAPMSTEKLRVGAVKIIIDGSIQAFSAKLRWLNWPAQRKS